jgi:hypothetical protein
MSYISGVRCGPEGHRPVHEAEFFLLIAKTVPIIRHPVATMSQDPLQSPEISSSSNYQLNFDNAITAFKRKTGIDITADPLFCRLRSCDSPDTALALLREQIPGFDQSESSGHRLSNWLDPTVNVLYTFSSTIGGAVSLVSVGILKVKASHSRLVL